VALWANTLASAREIIINKNVNHKQSYNNNKQEKHPASVLVNTVSSLKVSGRLYKNIWNT